MEEAVSQADQLSKLQAAARATYDLAKAGPRKEEIQQATAQAASAQHEVERLRDMMAKYTIRASFDGFVSAEHTEIGEWVNKGAPIVEIVELKHVDVMAMVPEGDVEHLKLGMKAGVDVNALPDAKFDGVVQMIVPQADVKSRSFPVKVRVENRFGSDGQPELKAGMFSRLRLRVREPAPALLVPKDAIVLGGEHPTLFIVQKEGERSTVRGLGVTLGESSKGMIAVTPINGTLAAGDLVVTEGNERRRTGDEVTFAKQE
jgi:RND family efflux transporter MFP subunit